MWIEHSEEDAGCAWGDNKLVSGLQGSCIALKLSGKARVGKFIESPNEKAEFKVAFTSDHFYVLHMTTKRLILEARHTKKSEPIFEAHYGRLLSESF